jgi:Protein of unknown function (DUF3050)
MVEIVAQRAARHDEDSVSHVRSQMRRNMSVESLPRLNDCDIDSIRQRMIEHPLFSAIRDIESLRVFMQAHVFAVWDFMSPAKRLQRDLTCVEVPWMPPRDRHGAQLINQIVLGEETDVGLGGEPVSHLELYLGAMREVGADATSFEVFQSTLANGATLTKAFDCAAVAPFVREFTGHTLQVASKAPLLAVMASFFYGREDVYSAHVRQLAGKVAHRRRPSPALCLLSETPHRVGQ